MTPEHQPIESLPESNISPEELDSVWALLAEHFNLTREDYVSISVTPPVTGTNFRIVNVWKDATADPEIFKVDTSTGETLRWDTVDR